MKEPRIWSSVTADDMPVVVLKDGVFYGTAIQVSEFTKVKKAIEAGDEPAQVLGRGCRQVALTDITRVVAKNTGDLVMEADGKVALQLPMSKAGVHIVEAIENDEGHRWEARVESKSRIGKAILSVVLGIVFGAGMIMAYLGIVSGRIDRIHWLAAFLVNNLGAWSLLAIGALIFLIGVTCFAYYLTHPAETWTLEEE